MHLKQAKEPWDLAVVESWESEVKAELDTLARKGLTDAYAIVTKQERVTAVNTVKETAISVIKAKFGEDISYVKVGGMFKKLEGDIVRGNILSTSKRIDGRGLADVRQIESETKIFPRYTWFCLVYAW